MEEWGWKNGDCVGNRVNRMSVQAGGQTNNGLVAAVLRLVRQVWSLSVLGVVWREKKILCKLL